MPAVCATWVGAGVAIGLPWAWSAVGAGASAAAAGAGAWVALAARPGTRTGTGARLRVLGNGRALGNAAALCAAMFAALATVLLATALTRHDLQRSPLAQAAASGTGVSVTLRIDTAPRPLASAHGPAQVFFEATLVQARSDGRQVTGSLRVRVIAGSAWANVPDGARARTVGRMRPGDPRERAAGIFKPATPPHDVQPRAHDPAGAVPGAWAQASGAVWQHASPDAAALLPGMVAGDRSAVDPGLDAAMKTVGLSHLTAVSGANCSIIVAALTVGLRTLRVPRWPTTALGMLGLGAFVAVVGPDASVLRAAVMGAIGALAMLGGRPKRVGALLSVTIIVLLAADPWLSADYAFILSVAATLGLHLVGRRCARLLSARLPGWLAQAIAIPLAAQLFCAPVIVMLSPRLTPYTVPANMAAAPVVALVTTVGTAGMAAAPLLPLVAWWCAAASGLGAWWTAAVAHGMAGLPGSSLPWPDGVGGAVLMAGLEAGVVGAVAAVAARRRLPAAWKALRGRLPARYRVLFGFGPLTVCAALAAALVTVVVTGW